MNFLSSDESIQRKNLVFIEDTSSFVLKLIQERNLDPLTAFVRISLDGGGAFLKVIVNVFDALEDTLSNSFLNSGVQRCQILAIAEEVPESNHNLRLILEKLNLDDVSFHLAFDLKCANAVFGLSSHSGKHSCLWCEGLSTLERGTLRTLGSLDTWYCLFAENGFNKKEMKNYMNVINPRILYLCENPDTILENLVPPPELHLLIGFVKSLGTLLLDAWPGFDQWLKSKNIFQRGYQGRGWDGNNSNRILANLDNLEVHISSNMPILLPVVQCLKDFRSVKVSCFGKTLEPGYDSAFALLKNSFLSAQEAADIVGHKLNCTWKIHILLCHVVPFVEYHKCGLSKFAEQCGEAIHAKFKPTWSRYKRQSEHQEHGKRLTSSVLDFNTRRIS